MTASFNVVFHKKEIFAALFKWQLLLVEGWERWERMCCTWHGMCRVLPTFGETCLQELWNKRYIIEIPLPEYIPSICASIRLTANQEMMYQNFQVASKLSPLSPSTSQSHYLQQSHNKKSWGRRYANTSLSKAIAIYKIKQNNSRNGQLWRSWTVSFCATHQFCDP